MKYIDYDLISELVYHEKPYIIEFASATEASFTEFKNNYREYLLKRDEENFRKAGHKIKPVAQMLNITDVVDEYEHAKKLLWEEKDDQQLEESVKKMEDICNTILEELKTIEEDA